MRAGGRTLLRTDRGRGEPVAGFADGLDLGRVCAAAGAVLVSDYGRGVAADRRVRAALRRAAARGVPVVWDPHPRGPEPVPGVTVVTPNLGEACDAAGGAPPRGHDEALALAGRLVGRWGAGAVAVTLGRDGAVVRHRDGGSSEPAAPVVPEADPCGGGGPLRRRGRRGARRRCGGGRGRRRGRAGRGRVRRPRGRGDGTAHREPVG